MFNDFIGQVVTVIVSSRADSLLEYTGVLQSENDETIVLSGVNISYLLANIQKGVFGDSATRLKVNLDRVIINKQFIVSCNS